MRRIHRLWLLYIALLLSLAFAPGDVWDPREVGGMFGRHNDPFENPVSMIGTTHAKN